MLFVLFIWWTATITEICIGFNTVKIQTILETDAAASPSIPAHQFPRLVFAMPELVYVTDESGQGAALAENELKNLERFMPVLSTLS